MQQIEAACRQQSQRSPGVTTADNCGDRDCPPLSLSLCSGDQGLSLLLCTSVFGAVCFNTQERELVGRMVHAFDLNKRATAACICAHTCMTLIRTFMRASHCSSAVV